MPDHSCGERAGTSAGVDPAPMPAAVGSLVRRLQQAGCVYAEDEAALLLAEASGPARLEAMLAERVAGRPLELVLGWAELAGVRVRVEPGVFVPRRRTELMVREAVALVVAAAGAGGRPVLVDLCCGTGAVGLAVLAGLGAGVAAGVELHACDVDPAAVRCARANLGGHGTVHGGDLDRSLPDSVRGRVAVLAANVPYVPSAEIALLPAEARLHEPRRTLDGGPDGLRVVARVADVAPRWLAPGGSVLVETGERQVRAGTVLLADAGLVVRTVRDEELGATVLVGRRP
ncbi:MAG: putative protein N(5)-glutamine methyltransferase [Nocardioidaceae bacterium]